MDDTNSFRSFKKIYIGNKLPPKMLPIYKFTVDKIKSDKMWLKLKLFVLRDRDTKMPQQGKGN